MLKKNYIGELWVNIRGFDYQVSNFGRVRSVSHWIYHYKSGKAFKKGKMINPSHNRKGYSQVSLSKDGVAHHYMVHRLVAEAFIPNPKHLPQVNHKDEDKTNNRLSNLEWCTVKYNIRYGSGIERQSNGHLNHPSLSREVDVYNLDYSYILTCPSAREASRRTGVPDSTIRAICRGVIQNPSKFIFKYKS